MYVRRRSYVQGDVGHSGNFGIFHPPEVTHADPSLMTTPTATICSLWFFLCQGYAQEKAHLKQWYKTYAFTSNMGTRNTRRGIGRRNCEPKKALPDGFFHTATFFCVSLIFRTVHTRLSSHACHLGLASISARTAPLPRTAPPELCDGLTHVFVHSVNPPSCGSWLQYTRGAAGMEGIKAGEKNNRR